MSLNPANTNAKPVRILLVDSDTVHLQSVAEILQVSGHQVEVTSRLQDAMAICQSPIDLVVLDSRWAKTYGVELIAQARDSGAKAIVLMSADLAHLEFDLHDAFIDEVCVKPVSPFSILDLMVRYCSVDFVAEPIGTDARPSLLVVDDEAVMLDFIDAVLSDDVLVQRAIDANSAIAMLKVTPFDILLTDFQLGDMSGLELSKIAKDIQPELSVIMMTAHASTQLMEQCFHAGLNDFVTKPLSPETLLASIRRTWAFIEKKKENYHLYSTLWKTNNKLSESENRFRLMMDHAAIGFLYYDVNGKIIDANKRMENYLHCTQSEIVGGSIFEIDTRLSPEKLARQWSLLEDIPYINLESEYRRKDGWTFPAELTISRGDVDNQELVCVVKDIASRKETEAVNHMLYAALEQSKEAIFVSDVDGRVRYVNAAYEKLTGYPQNEVLGRIASVFWDNDEKTISEVWVAILGGKSWEKIVGRTRKTGEPYEESILVSPIMDDQGRLSHILGVSRDVTEQMLREERERQSLKLQSIGTMSSGIAHDINNILAPIMGFTELALIQQPKDSPAVDSLNEVIKAAQRAKNIVRQILDFSRGESREYGRLKLAEEVRDVLNLLRTAIPTSIKIEQHIDSDCNHIIGDSTQIHEIIMNIGINASHALENVDNGVLKISVERETVTDALASQNPDLKIGEYTVLTIEDNGCGMPKEVQDRIFEPFYSTKGVGKGSGLGLAVVHGFMTEMGGAVLLNSEVGRGSRFRLYFAAAD